MGTFRVVRGPDYPFPVIFFKKDLEKIRSYSKTRKEQRDLQSIYFSVREIISDIDEGLTKSDNLTYEGFCELVCEMEGKEYRPENIITIKSLLLELQSLGIYTFYATKIVE